MKGNSGRSGSSKYWATILYDVKDLNVLDDALKRFHLKCILSPLHDSDTKEHVDVINGREYKSLRFKEPHYHLMVHFPNGVSERSFRYLLEHKIPEGIHFKGAELIFSFNGMARYFCHLDNPEKFQYDRDDMLYYCGLNEECLDSPHKDNVDKTSDIQYFVDIIMEHQIDDMMTLYMYVYNACPSKMSLFLSHSAQLERFTRGMYQLNQKRKEMLNNE